MQQDLFIFMLFNNAKMVNSPLWKNKLPCKNQTLLLFNCSIMIKDDKVLVYPFLLSMHIQNQENCWITYHLCCYYLLFSCYYLLWEHWYRSPVDSCNTSCPGYNFHKYLVWKYKTHFILYHGATDLMGAAVRHTVSTCFQWL